MSIQVFEGDGTDPDLLLGPDAKPEEYKALAAAMASVLIAANHCKRERERKAVLSVGISILKDKLDAASFERIMKMATAVAERFFP